MRQALSPRKVARIREQTGLPVVYAFARGDSDHTIWLLLENCRTARLLKTGEVVIPPLYVVGRKVRLR